MADAVDEPLDMRLRALRKQKRWTVEYVASQLGVSRQSVWKWETGLALPRGETLVALGRLFNATLDYPINDIPRPSAVAHETCGERIKRLRITRNFTQKQLAERLGGSHYRTVGQWEDGSRIPSSNLLAELARALGVTMDYLMTGRESAVLAAIKAQIRQHAPYDRLLALVSAND